MADIRGGSSSSDGLAFADHLQVRRAAPVKWWAFVGVISLSIAAFALTAWIITGNAKATPNGPTPVPAYMAVTARIHEILSVILTIVAIYFFLLRPWRRDRRLTPDGLMLLAFGSLYWQDPLPGMLGRITFVYNTTFWQWGSWANFIPGWLVPRGNLYAEPLVFIGGMYIWLWLPAVIIANHIMRGAKARWPRLGTLGLLSICFAVIVAIDLLVELTWLRLGLYSYPSAISWATLFHGRYYQFPVYEALLGAGVWTAFAAIRFFKTDRGQTIAERGLENLRSTPRRNTALRFLALAGMMNVMYFSMYNLPMALIALNTGGWPAEIVNRSYLTNSLCGPSTDMACPSHSVPIPHDNSAYLTPDGRVVFPHGTHLTGQGR